MEVDERYQTLNRLSAKTGDENVDLYPPFPKVVNVTPHIVFKTIQGLMSKGRMFLSAKPR